MLRFLFKVGYGSLWSVYTGKPKFSGQLDASGERNDIYRSEYLVVGVLMNSFYCS